MNENNNTPTPGLKPTQNASPSMGMSPTRIIGLILLIGGCLVLVYLLYKWRFLVFGSVPSGRPMWHRVCVRCMISGQPSVPVRVKRAAVSPRNPKIPAISRAQVSSRCAMNANRSRTGPERLPKTGILLPGTVTTGALQAMAAITAAEKPGVQVTLRIRM